MFNCIILVAMAKSGNFTAMHPNHSCKKNQSKSHRKKYFRFNWNRSIKPIEILLWGTFNTSSYIRVDDAVATLWWCSTMPNYKNNITLHNFIIYLDYGNASVSTFSRKCLCGRKVSVRILRSVWKDNNFCNTIVMVVFFYETHWDYTESLMD